MAQTDTERRHSEIEEKARKFEEQFRTIGDEFSALDKRRRKLGEKYDRLLESAATFLDSDEYHEIFGTFPDESGKADPPADAPKRSQHEKRILSVVENVLELDPEHFDPRHIEAVIRTRFQTFDQFSASEFQTEIVIATAALVGMTFDERETLAQSYGI